MADLHEYKESLSENLMQVIALLEEYGFDEGQSHSHDYSRPVSYTHLDVYKRQVCATVAVYLFVVSVLKQTLVRVRVRSRQLSNPNSLKLITAILL